LRQEATQSRKEAAVEERGCAVDKEAMVEERDHSRGKKPCSRGKRKFDRGKNIDWQIAIENKKKRSKRLGSIDLPIAKKRKVLKKTIRTMRCHWHTTAFSTSGTLST